MILSTLLVKEAVLWYINIFWVFNKNNNNWPLHCVSWINSSFPKNKNTYIKVRTKLLVKQQDMFYLKFKRIA